MHLSDAPGYLEEIQIAVRPLTDSGEFWLERITWNRHYRSSRIVNLCSPDLDIGFSANGEPETSVECFFLVNSVKKVFSFTYLLPVLDSYERNKHPVDLVTYFRNLVTSGPRKESRAGFVAISLTNRDAVEIHRSCIALQKAMPKIQAAFSGKNIDTTIRAYLSKQKERGWGGDPAYLEPECFSDIVPDRDRKIPGTR